jgi:hypothetical protein
MPKFPVLCFSCSFERWLTELEVLNDPCSVHSIILPGTINVSHYYNLLFFFFFKHHSTLGEGDAIVCQALSIDIASHYDIINVVIVMSVLGSRGHRSLERGRGGSSVPQPPPSPIERNQKIRDQSHYRLPCPRLSLSIEDCPFVSPGLLPHTWFGGEEGSAVMVP